MPRRTHEGRLEEANRPNTSLCPQENEAECRCLCGGVQRSVFGPTAIYGSPSFQNRRAIHANSTASAGSQGVATQGEQRKLASLVKLKPEVA